MTKAELYKVIYKHPMKTVSGALRYDCGELLSRGLNRDVYVCKHDPKWVIKIQKTTNFDNTMEWKIWLSLYRSSSEYKKWFPDCLTITESGLVLVQQRIFHGDIKDYPKKIPYFFTDLKIQNYGWIGGRFVCCDYANVMDNIIRSTSNKLKTAKWWESDGKVKRTKSMSIRSSF